MQISVKPGRYVIAVSGGVDSVVLLNMLSKVSQLDLIVAHFDHGIRLNSVDDEHFVQNVANEYGLRYISERRELGSSASEATARKERYNFLERVKIEYNANAIITAHHHDDVLETMVINVLRGTNRAGYSSLKSGPILRPLIDFSKAEIIDYAENNKLTWREDPTNQSERYLRNRVRRQLEMIDLQTRQQLVSISQENRDRNQEMDKLCAELLNIGFNAKNSLKRSFFIALPYDVTKELLSYWLRINAIDFDRNTLQRAVIFLKTGKRDASYDVGNGWIFKIGDNQISLISPSSV